MNFNLKKEFYIADCSTCSNPLQLPLIRGRAEQLLP
jgi:hypothetical protein